MTHDPFAIPPPPRSLLRRAAMIAARPLLSRCVGLATYREVYARTHAMPGDSFFARALIALDIDVRCGSDDVIRATPGPLIVATNHPHGLLDGLAVGSLVFRARRDVRILTNRWLSSIPELEDLCFFVDPFGGPEAAARSQRGLRAAHRWLRRGGALVVFPAGEVAHRWTASRTLADGLWNVSVARLATATGARVIPGHIGGSNSRMFYAAGRLHPRLRTLLLPRELLTKRGQSVHVAFGPAIAAEELARESVDAATMRIRAAVERLESSAVAAPRDAIAREVGSLPPDCRLIATGDFDVYCAQAHQIPSTLQEIGRLREVTFRAVGEGTGRELDLDRFDEHYLHLFAWDRERHQVIGAYRIGQTDDILAGHGASGLYTRTLFRFDERLLERLSPALELGRSFVRAEYQKNYNALLSLWKGVARYVALHPQYRVLFGPVSISARYSDVSQRLLMRFLEQNHRQAELAPLVSAHNPARRAAAAAVPTPETVAELERLVARAEPDGKGVPVLLRQYLKLNARVLGFNVDPDFGDVLDALMVVDLTDVDRGILNRYFGRREAATFLAHHTAKAA